MKVNIIQLQEIFLKKLGIKLAKFGFDSAPVGQSYYRTFAQGKSSVHVSFIDHGNQFDLTIDIAVRFDEVEDIINSFNKYLSKKDKKDTFTLGVELGNLIKRSPLRWEISSEKNIEDVIGSIVETFEKHGEPYLNRYSNMENAFEVFSCDDKDAWIYSPIDHVRAQSSVVLAKILDKPNINELIERKKMYLEARNDFGLPDYLELADKIHEHPS